MIHVDDNDQLAHLSGEHLTAAWLLIADILLARLAPVPDGATCTLCVTRFDAPVIRQALTEFRDRHLELARNEGVATNELPNAGSKEEAERLKLCYVKKPNGTTGCLLPRDHKGKHRDVDGAEWRPSANEPRYGE